jgi:hypothetical protein
MYPPNGQRYRRSVGRVSKRTRSAPVGRNQHASARIINMQRPPLWNSNAIALASTVWVGPFKRGALPSRKGPFMPQSQTSHHAEAPKWRCRRHSVYQAQSGARRLDDLPRRGLRRNIPRPLPPARCDQRVGSRPVKIGGDRAVRSAPVTATRPFGQLSAHS